MTKSRGILAPRRPWTEHELQILRRDYPHKDSKQIAVALNRSVLGVYQRAQIEGLQKSPQYTARKKNLERDRLLTSGVSHRFAKGHVPANKGTRRPGWAPGRMRETQFKKGARPQTWKPIGSTRISKDGILQQKVTDTGNPPDDWKSVHAVMWEEAYGPIPDGHIIVFKDGDRKNLALENLECVSRRELMRRNSFRTNYPKEIGMLIQLRGAVMRQIRKRDAKQDR